MLESRHPSARKVVQFQANRSESWQRAAPEASKKCFIREVCAWDDRCDAVTSGRRKRRAARPTGLVCTRQYWKCVVRAYDVNYLATMAFANECQKLLRLHADAVIGRAGQRRVGVAETGSVGEAGDVGSEHGEGRRHQLGDALHEAGAGAWRCSWRRRRCGKSKRRAQAESCRRRFRASLTWHLPRLRSP
jgi:hypothetical protein